MKNKQKTFPTKWLLSINLWIRAKCRVHGAHSSKSGLCFAWEKKTHVTFVLSLSCFVHPLNVKGEQKSGEQKQKSIVLPEARDFIFTTVGRGSRRNADY